jgi:hypothetical protein
VAKALAGMRFARFVFARISRGALQFDEDILNSHQIQRFPQIIIRKLRFEIGWAAKLLNTGDDCKLN